MALKTKIFLSDEGFGHIVRQRAITEEMLLLDPGIEITVQTSHHLDTATRFIRGKHFIDRFNNIV